VTASDVPAGRSAPGRLAAAREAGRGLFSTFALSWIVAIILLATIVNAGGFWNILGNTRLLSPLIRGGIIALTDQDEGLIYGVPDLNYYLYASDPVDWELIALAGLIFILVWAIKSLQFHGLARFCGIDGSFGQHARAYFYGHGINRLFPFDMGKVASASALEGQGVPLERAGQVVYLGGLFIIFETVTFALYGLATLGINRWLAEIAWPVIILIIAFLLTRARRGEGPGVRDWLRTANTAVRALAREPGLQLRLAALSLVSFFLVEVGAYLISQAFTSANVILNIEFSVILMAVVGGYIARLIPFTPGGLGQWEWGFASALYVGGLGMPEAATLALLVAAVRYVTGGILFGTMMLTRGVDTSLTRVFQIYRRVEPLPRETA
jgi:uncharacterized membrane protein YbhN (UPF0104 family)